MTTQYKKTLIIGGTGKTGRRIVDRFKKKGLPVHIGARNGDTPFDWDRPETWKSALLGMKAVYVAFAPDLAIPEAADKIRELTRLAEQAGVERMVLLSGRGEVRAQACEAIVRESQVPSTIIRASWFAQNFSENFFRDDLLRGEVVLPVGEVTEPFIDVEDIADVAWVSLTEEGHAGRTYEVTGPRLLTFASAVAEISAQTGREIRYRQVTPGEYELMLREVGVPPEQVAFLMHLFTEVLDGRNSRVATGVQDALGRAPRDFSQFVARAATLGQFG